MGKYEVESWRKWDYPSHWDYEESFDTIEEAKEYISQEKKNWKGTYRIIQEIPYD